jgi:hypothetical protein
LLRLAKADSFFVQCGYEPGGVLQLKDDETGNCVSERSNPSECLSSSQAQQVPKGVLECPHQVLTLKGNVTVAGHSRDDSMKLL